MHRPHSRYEQALGDGDALSVVITKLATILGNEHTYGAGRRASGQPATALSIVLVNEAQVLGRGCVPRPALVVAGDASMPRDVACGKDARMLIAAMRPPRT